MFVLFLLHNQCLLTRKIQENFFFGFEDSYFDSVNPLRYRNAVRWYSKEFSRFDECALDVNIHCKKIVEKLVVLQRIEFGTSWYFLRSQSSGLVYLAHISGLVWKMFLLRLEIPAPKLCDRSKGSSIAIQGEFHIFSNFDKGRLIRVQMTCRISSNSTA